MTLLSLLVGEEIPGVVPPAQRPELRTDLHFRVLA